MSVVPDAATTQSIAGIGFFTQHALFIDFTERSEAWLRVRRRASRF